MPFIWLAAEGVEAELLTRERRSNQALVLDITMSTLYWLLELELHCIKSSAILKSREILSIILILLSKMPMRPLSDM
jgi:hypothetical protein